MQIVASTWVRDIAEPSLCRLSAPTSPPRPMPFSSTSSSSFHPWPSTPTLSPFNSSVQVSASLLNSRLSFKEVKGLAKGNVQEHFLLHHHLPRDRHTDLPSVFVLVDDTFVRPCLCIQQ